MDCGLDGLRLEQGALMDSVFEKFSQNVFVGRKTCFLAKQGTLMDSAFEKFTKKYFWGDTTAFLSKQGILMVQHFRKVRQKLFLGAGKQQFCQKRTSNSSKVGDGDDDDGDDGGIIFPGQLGPITNAPRDNITRKGYPQHLLGIRSTCWASAALVRH